MEQQSEEKPKIFQLIVSGKIPCSKVYEDDDFLAFNDIAPSAPFHCLLCPKKLSGLTSLATAGSEHVEILGRMLVVVAKIAQENKLEKGFRTVFNSGPDSFHNVDYIHCHILGQRQMTWPPGIEK